MAKKAKKTKKSAKKTTDTSKKSSKKRRRRRTKRQRTPRSSQTFAVEVLVDKHSLTLTVDAANISRAVTGAQRTIKQLAKATDVRVVNVRELAD